VLKSSKEKKKRGNLRHLPASAQQLKCHCTLCVNFALIQHSLMKVCIYNMNVIFRATYTPKIVFACICYALKTPWVDLGDRGVGSACVLHAIKCVSYAHENCVSYRHNNYCWCINGTRNNIHCIDMHFHEIGLIFVSFAIFHQVVFITVLKCFYYVCSGQSGLFCCFYKNLIF